MTQHTDALWDDRVRAEQPDRPRRVGEVRRDVVRHPGVKPKGRDPGVGERRADECAGLAEARASGQARDPADDRAVGQVQDPFDLRRRDGERDALEH